METNDTNPNQNSNTFYVQEKQQLPNSTAVLVLGILSIVGCWLYAIPGLAMGIISIILANNGEKLYKSNPEMYYEPSYKNLKAGRICAIIGVSLSGLALLTVFIILAVAGFGVLSAFNFLH